MSAGVGQRRPAADGAYRGVCPHDCPDTCGLICEVRDGRVTEVRGDPDHPITGGWLCAKLADYAGYINHPDRLTHPLRRVGAKGEGRWQRVSWEAAIDEISRRWREIIARHGAEAILPYSYSGTLGQVQMEVCNHRLWNRLGASRLARTICAVGAARAVNATVGARWAPAYQQVEASRLVLLWGHNPVSTAPHFMPFLRRAQRGGARVVVIDPIRTRSARGADLHLAPRPGTDAALALGLAYVLLTEGLIERDWIDAHCLGWEALEARIREYPPQRVAEITGVDAQAIIDLGRLYGRTRPALIKIADGVNRNRNGGQTVRAIAMLPALVGQYGKLGGGLSYSTSGYLQWDTEALGHASACPPPGRVINMNRLGAALTGEASEPPVQALYVWGANPVASSPNAGRIVEGLLREDLFTVVHEQFMTDTARYADLVLPATAQFEHADLHKAYGHGWLAYSPAVATPPGEARSNWEVMGMLARGMGFEDAWLQQTPDEVIAELLEATAPMVPGLAGVGLERLQTEGALAVVAPDHVPFADGRFPTPSARVELYSAALAAEGHDPLPGWGGLDDEAEPPEGWAAADALSLVTPGAHHFVSSSFANVEALVRREGRPLLVLHPDDARRRGVEAGMRVRVENRRGWFEVEAQPSDAVPVGVAATPKGWWPADGGGRNVNWTTPDAPADLAGQSTFQSNRVWVRPA